MTNFIKRFLNILYKILFGYSLGARMKSFLRELSWSMISGIISALLTFLVMIMAAKVLGPAEFGKYNYITSFAVFLAFFCLLGADAGSVRFLASKDRFADRGKYFSASLTLVVLQTFILIVCLNVLQLVYPGLLGIPTQMLYLVECLILTYAFKNQFENYLRAFRKIKIQSALRISSSLLSVILFLIFYTIGGNNSYIYLVYMFIGSYLLFPVFGFAALKKNLCYFSFSHLWEISKYNLIFSIGLIGGLLLSLEKFFIGEFLGLTTLGQYSYYYISTFLVISALGSNFMNVFWPEAIRSGDQLTHVSQKMALLLTKLFPLWFVVSIFLSWLLFLFERAFGFPLFLIFLLSIVSFMLFSFNVFIALLNIKLVKIGAAISLSNAIVAVAILLILKSLSLYLICQIILYFISIIFIMKLIKNDKSKKE